MNKLDNIVFNIKHHLSYYDTMENYKLSTDDINIIEKIPLEYNFTEKSYNRNVIYRDDMIEILILVWDKNATTPMHKHPDNGCILYMIDGKIIENRQSEYCSISSVISSGMQSYIDNSMGVHQIVALEKSYSLHIYSPPNFYNK